MTAAQFGRDVEPLWRERIGFVLRTRRHQAGLRLVDVASRAGVSPQYLSEVERGRKDPSSEVFAAIAGALDLTVLDIATHALTSVDVTLSGSSTLCLAA